MASNLFGLILIVVVGVYDFVNELRKYEIKRDLDISKRSEEAALKAYPKKREGDSRGSYDSNSLSRAIYKRAYEQAEKELLNKLEEIQAEYKGMSHDAKSQENYIYASGLCEATARIIKLVKDDEEQTE